MLQSAYDLHGLGEWQHNITSSRCYKLTTLQALPLIALQVHDTTSAATRGTTSLQRCKCYSSWRCKLMTLQVHNVASLRWRYIIYLFIYFLFSSFKSLQPPPLCTRERKREQEREREKESFETCLVSLFPVSAVGSPPLVLLWSWHCWLAEV